MARHTTSHRVDGVLHRNALFGQQGSHFLDGVLSLSDGHAVAGDDDNFISVGHLDGNVSGRGGLHRATVSSAAGDSMPPAGQFAGRVADYYDSEANPLFELEIGGRRVLVPAAEEFIAHIDFEGRTMKMILPEGLIDL